MNVAKKEEDNVITLDVKQEQALKIALASIEKEFGAGAVQQYGHGEPIPGVEFIPSGCFSLDKALGRGYAKGRIVEIYGPASAGKTTLALLAIANAQKTDTRKALFIDVEHALDPQYAEKLGVDMTRLLISQPDSGEEALNILDTLLKSGAISLIVLDSVAALAAQKELEGNIGDQSMGVQARLMSQTMRMIVGSALRNETTIIFLNQIRMKIGVMYGNPETTSGGNSLGFYASQRLDVRRRDKVEGTEHVIGFETEVKIVKNKVAPPFRTAEFTIKFGEGIDWAQDLVKTAVAAGKIEKSGAWCSFNGERISQGEPNAAQYFRDNPDKTALLKAALNT
jgi:recombination protein RecA